MHLKKGIDKQFQLYPKSFDKGSMIVLETLVKNENKTDYKSSTLVRKIILDSMRLVLG